MFDIDKMLNELESWNESHASELNPTQGEKELQELKQAVATLKADRKARDEANSKARKIAVDKSNNIAVDRYVALVQQKRKEFKEYYY